MSSFTPDTLENLAMEAIEDHVSQVCIQIMLNSIPDDIKLHHAQEKFYKLRHLLHYTLPPIIANRVTTKLLKRIDSFYDEVRKVFKETWFQEVLFELLDAVIHPGVTHLELGTEPMHCFDYRFDLNFIVLFLLEKLWTMNDLKVIRFSNQYCRELWAKDIRITENLEEFTSVSSDALLEAVTQSCKKLKRLHINWSPDVTDASVGNILSLLYLEELSVMGKISHDGLKRLLNGFVMNRSPLYKDDRTCSSQLLSFGCYNISSPHINILVEHYPNLVELKLLSSCECDFSPVKNLKNLQCLWLSNIKFSEIKQLINAVGSQLLYLHLIYAEAVDMKFIGEYCPSLKCLHLIAYEDSNPFPEDMVEPILPGFQSVECLHLNFPSTGWPLFFLIQCISVKKVVIYLRNVSNCQFLLDTLHQVSLTCLEEIYWSPPCPYAGSIIKLLVGKCPNLKVIKPLDR